MAKTTDQLELIIRLFTRASGVMANMAGLAGRWPRDERIISTSTGTVISHTMSIFHSGHPGR